jgi:hypothetical protein
MTRSSTHRHHAPATIPAVAKISRVEMLAPCGWPNRYHQAHKAPRDTLSYRKTEMKNSRVARDCPWQQFLMMEREAKDALKEGKAALAGSILLACPTIPLQFTEGYGAPL